MANGRIVFGSTDYIFAKNWKWKYVNDLSLDQIVNISTDGVITVETQYSWKEFALEFRGISDTQRDIFEQAAIAGLVTFYPDADVSTSYTGLWQKTSKSEQVFTNRNNMSITFREGK